MLWLFPMPHVQLIRGQDYTNQARDERFVMGERHGLKGRLQALSLETLQIKGPVQYLMTLQ